MRIMMLLAAAGVAAIGTTAQARPGGPSTGSPGAWAPAPGARAGGGSHGPSRPGMGHGRRDGRHGGRFGGGLYFHEGLGLAVAPYGNGFFAGGGGEVRMQGNRPRYDYDRSYPYEWNSAHGSPPPEDEALPAGPGPRCTIEHRVRVCRGW